MFLNVPGLAGNRRGIDLEPEGRPGKNRPLKPQSRELLRLYEVADAIVCSAGTRHGAKCGVVAISEGGEDTRSA